MDLAKMVKDTLKPGLKHRFAYTVTPEKTVPHIYPESPEMAAMPAVFATGFMVALMEWACVQLLAPHLEDGEGSLGIHVDVSHVAATPPGLTVTVDAEVESIEGTKLWFKVRAHDGIDLIGEGRHRRAIVAWDRFNERVIRKISIQA